MKRTLALLALVNALPAHAIDRIRLRATSIAAADTQLLDVQATLQISGAQRSTIAVHAARVQLPQALEAQSGQLTALQLHCTNPVVREPLLDCPTLTLQAQSTRWSAIQLEGQASYHTDSGAFSATSGGMTIAGAPLKLRVEGDPTNIQAQLSLQGMQLAAVKSLLSAQQLALPADLALTGRGNLDASVTLRDQRSSAAITMALSDVGFQNSAYTQIGEKLTIEAVATADFSRTPTAFVLQLTAGTGQALTGPVLLDFDQNPLQLQLRGNFSPTSVVLEELRSEQRDMATMTGTAQIGLAPFVVQEALVQATDIRFPAAYSSYLQLALATTPFNQLTTTGSATLRLAVRDNQPTQLDLVVSNLLLSDASRALQVEGVDSELHWAAALTGPPRPSWLSWESSQGWGIQGARTRLDFVTQDRDFRLTQPARLPFFDGALLITTLAADNIGTDIMKGAFDAEVEPISIGPIAKALGLPEFSGQLSGRIPGLTYRDKTLELQGNLEADVFDGHVVASNLRLREPLGAWPRLYGDIVARNLDLALITNTFEFGNITGKLDIDLNGLETFNWSPIAFDLRMATPPGDRSRHRISQRAVQNISDIGGGGSGVAAALQSGALKFFDEFGYDRIGLSCRLRNEICEMAGVGAVKDGFYIVKGKGLPRIDIIGNNQRLDWPRFLSQVLDAVRNPEGIELK